MYINQNNFIKFVLTLVLIRQEVAVRNGFQNTFIEYREFR